jgi:hypothetical protein
MSLLCLSVSITVCLVSLYHSRMSCVSQRLTRALISMSCVSLPSVDQCVLCLSIVSLSEFRSCLSYPFFLPPRHMGTPYLSTPLPLFYPSSFAAALSSSLLFKIFTRSSKPPTPHAFLYPHVHRNSHRNRETVPPHAKRKEKRRKAKQRETKDCQE